MAVKDRREIDKGKTRILIVDDHPIVREHLAELIEQQRDLAVCGQVGTAQECLEAVAATKPDLAIVDLSLKGTPGLDLIKDLRERHDGLPVLVLSMHDEALFAERALRAGAKGYITKQEATQNILRAIRCVLDGRVYLSDQMAAVLLQKVADGGVQSVSSPIEELTDRELQVFTYLGRGIGTRQIAEEMSLSVKTIETYCARIKEKLGLKDASQLLQHAVQWVQTHGG